MIKKIQLLVVSLGFWAGCLAQTLSTKLVFHGDSATGAASLKYKNPSFLKRLFLGKNYRTTWAAPVTLPLFHLRRMGFTIKELGGGQQTKSLQLVDKNGHEWALRTIDKDVEKALPPVLRNTIAESVTQDMVSAAHPYAPLVIPPLAQAAGVVAAQPRYYFVPGDPDLGEYSELFKNTMCMLEDREPTPDQSETDKTETLLKTLLKRNEVHVDGEAVLRARLLDMLVADWDRHEKQWRWGFEKVKGGQRSYAIPRDRDQAFFYSDGLLVKLVRVVAMKHLAGFTKSTKKLKKLNTKAWNFDQVFLNNLSAQDWNRVAQRFSAALPDSLIEAAVRKLPPEIYAINGPQVAQKLISRRNSLPKDALRYYRFLAPDVTIVGSDARERFVITRAKDSLTVQQFTGPDFSEAHYRRTFYRNETDAVTILGLEGADEFIEQGSRRSRIRLVLDGGAGDDQYHLESRRNIRVQNSQLTAKRYLPVLKKALRITD